MQADIAMQPLVLTAEQVGALLNVGADTVEGLHRLGRLRGVKVGRYLRWTLTSVRQYVETLEEDK